MKKSKDKVAYPTSETTMELLKKDTTLKFIDNIGTPQKETIKDAVLTSFHKAVITLLKYEDNGGLEWSKINKGSVYHLLKANMPGFSRPNLNVGGNDDIINAIHDSHGPSWRMIVSLTQKTEAYGVYPGGQSGNPGSKYYDDYVNNWAEGKYFPLWMMNKAEATDKKVMATINFKKR